MDKLRITIEQYIQWKGLAVYVDRIEAALVSDFSLALENAKSLLETIGKEICKVKGEVLGEDDFHHIIKKAFSALGYNNSAMVNQISRSLSSIALQIGTLRNEISPTAHGKTLEELRERNNRVDVLTREFLKDSTVIVAVFMIRAFEERNGSAALPSVKVVTEEKLKYDDEDEFNMLWDDTYGEFRMDEYSYNASEILYNVDYKAYETECKAFNAAELEAAAEEASVEAP